MAFLVALKISLILKVVLWKYNAAPLNKIQECISTTITPELCLKTSVLDNKRGKYDK